MDDDELMDLELSELGHPEWSARLRREREYRGWTQHEAASRLRRLLPEEQVVSVDSLERMWKRWEGGAGVRLDYQVHLGTLFGSVRGALFAPPRRREPVADGSVAELLEQLQASMLDTASLTAIALTVDKLCSEYPYMPAEQLILEGRSWLARLVALVREPATLAQRREIQVQAGWLALLVACLQHDLGHTRAAGVTRGHALSLGAEAEHAGIQGWAHEIDAWIALTSGNVRGVLAAVEAGTGIAGQQAVAVQLAAQEAKAFARMGEHRRAAETLDRGRRQLEALPDPVNALHHFAVDHAKFDFYAMDVGRLSSDNAAAEHLAREVLAAGQAWDGTERTVMRCSQARLTLGVVAAREGDLEGAVHWGVDALKAGRRSLPALLLVADELTSAMTAVDARHRLVRDFEERVGELRRGR